MQFRDPRTRWQFLPGRRLLFEELERRDLLAVMRIVDWNTLNGPNNAADDANFQNDPAGNRQRNGAGQHEADRYSRFAGNRSARARRGFDRRVRDDTEYALSIDQLYLDRFGTVDGGGDSTGFVYDTSTVSLIESLQVRRRYADAQFMRGKFQPVGTDGDSDFYVYSVHLKSERHQRRRIRGAEAAVLCADANALGEGTHVLFVGDFNMKSSTERLTTNLLAAGAGQVCRTSRTRRADWLDNAAFKSLHSQDPALPWMIASTFNSPVGEFFDGFAFEYITNSYHVFGNNGTHTLNGAITTGTGASPAVLTALAAASDHLPVVADYDVPSATSRCESAQT